MTKTYWIAILAIMATIMIVSSIGWVKEIKVAMPVKKNVMVQYNNSVQAVAARTAR